MRIVVQKLTEELQEKHRYNPITTIINIKDGSVKYEIDTSIELDWIKRLDNGKA